jgi:cyanophycinase
MSFFLHRCRHALLAAVFCFAMTESFSQTAEPSQPAGALVIMGGAVRADTAEIWQRVVALAGGQGARIAVIAAAAGDPQASADRTIATLKRYGADAFFVPIAPRLLNADFKAAAQDPAIATQIAQAGGVFFTGGDQSRITQALRTATDRPTAALDAIWALYRRGGVIAGSSAGAAIMSASMFYEPPDVLSVLKFGVKPGTNGKGDIAPGLGFIGAGVFVDQHVLARGRFARMLPAMLAAGVSYGIGVDEDTAFIVTQGNTGEVIGSSGVILVDTRNAVQDPQQTDFNIRNVRLSYLERGDRLDLAHRRVTASAFKQAGSLLDPNAPGYRPEFDEPKFYADVLGKNVLIDIMTTLIDNTPAEAIGLALSSPGAPRPDLGFEMRFRKGAATRGHLRIDQGAAHYTVLNVELDIAPVKVAQPLYERR